MLPVVVACFALQNLCVHAGVPFHGDEFRRPLQDLPERVEAGAVEDQPGVANVHVNVLLALTRNR